MNKERLVECFAAESWRRASFNSGMENAGEMARRIRNDLRRISDSCMRRVGLRSNERKRPKYWWTDEIGELWKESCLARHRFGIRKQELFRRGGDFENIVESGVAGVADSGSPSDMEFEGGELKEAPERSEFGSEGSSVPHRYEEAAEFVGAADGQYGGEVSRQSDRGALPSHRALRFTSGELRLQRSHRGKDSHPFRRGLQEAHGSRRNGVHYRILGKSAEVLCSRLSLLYTACFEEALFPKQ